MKKSFLFMGAFMLLVVLSTKGFAALTSSFKDITSQDWFSEGVKYASDHELMTGYDNGNFGPNDPVNRAELATVLERMEAGSIESLYVELEAIRDDDTQQLMGSSWQEYVDAMRRFPIDGVQPLGWMIDPEAVDELDAVATDRVNGVLVLTKEAFSEDTTSTFFLQSSGLGAGVYGPFSDVLGPLVDEIEELNGTI